MQRELLSYALTIDRNERVAAARLGLPPRFELVNMRQLIAIDAMWSLQGYHPRPFEAIHIWESVYEHGKSFYPPESIDQSGFVKKIPAPKWLYVGTDWDSDPGFSPMYSGGRHLMGDFAEAVENIELKDGRVVMAMQKSSMFEVDEEGAELFLQFEVLDHQVHHLKAQYDPSEAFKHYQLLGTISTGTKHLGMIDDMLRRASWKRRHNMFSMDRESLLDRSITSAQRKDGLLCPPGQQTLKQDLMDETEALHDRRERSSWANRNG